MGEMHVKVTHMTYPAKYCPGVLEKMSDTRANVDTDLDIDTEAGVNTGAGLDIGVGFNSVVVVDAAPLNTT